MEENVRLAYLYDTYGELLSVRQREIFEAICFNDLSLSEIAEESNTSRQAAHDIYRRTVQKLESFEAALHLVEKYNRIKARVERIIHTADMNGAQGDASAIEIAALAKEVLEEL